MDSVANNSRSGQNGSADVLYWRTWSARRHPVAASAAVIFVLALTVAVYFCFDGIIYPVLVVLVLGAALSPYYLPTQFTLDAEGITISSLLGHRKRLWSRLSVYFPNGNDGVLVSPVARKGLLSTTRGIYLPYADNREAVLGYLRRHLPQGEASRSE